MKCAVIGCGMIANFAHIPAYRNRPNAFTVAGVCDGNLANARDTAARHGIPYSTDDAARMLAEVHPELVSVCVPNRFHKEYIRMALLSGAHVLCEKPLALTLADAIELYALAEEEGLALIACQNHRFTADRLAAKDWLASGELGEVHYGEAAWIRRRGIPKWGTFHMERFSGGGAMIDIGVHMIDAAVWLTGNTKPIAVTGTKSAYFAHGDDLASGLRESGAMAGQLTSARVYRADEFDVEDFASGSVRFGNGMRLNFKAAWACNLPEECSLKLGGTKGGICLPEGTVYGGFAGRTADIRPQIGDPFYPDQAFGGHFVMVDRLADYFAGNRALPVKPEETMAVTAILEMFYRSAALGREVSVTELENIG